MNKHIDHNSAVAFNIKKAIITALLLAGAMQHEIAHAAPLPTGTVLTINSPTYNSYSGYVSGGSWFGMDTAGNSVISPAEKTGLYQGSQSLIIGVAQAAGGVSHTGCPTGSDNSYINAPWCFFGNTGMNFTTVAVTGGTVTGLNLSGWTWTWAGIPVINMGGGVWGTGYTNGVANFTWDGVYGDGYTLDYHATVPIGSPSGFGGVKYALHLEGNVNAVPIPAAVWLFGSGLLGLFGVARRRKA